MTAEHIPIGKFGFIQRKFIDWALGHMNIVALGVVGVFFLVLGATKSIHYLTGESKQDYISAHSLYANWEGTKEGLGRLEKILRKHPELRSKYEGGIAQKLLILRGVDFLRFDAVKTKEINAPQYNASQKSVFEGYAAATLKRVGPFSYYYRQFSLASLKIGEGKLQEALQEAKSLKQSLEKDEGFWEKRSRLAAHGALLYGYNLLRIATLEKEVGSPQGEREAWKEFKQNAGWEDSLSLSKAYDPEAYKLIQKNFSSQEDFLKEYIYYRENSIAGDGSIPLLGDTSPFLQKAL